VRPAQPAYRLAAQPVARRRFSVARRRRLQRTAGFVLLLASAFPLASIGYQLFGTAASARHAQAQLRQQLASTSQLPACGPQRLAAGNQTSPGQSTAGTIRRPAGSSSARPRLGEALAQLRVPAAGVDDVIVEGARPGDLKKGPGHIAGTVLPGQSGTFAVSGHRTTYSSPFYHLDRLHPGDRISVSTATAVYTYTVTGSTVVPPDDTKVLANVAGLHGTQPTIVLTTCTPAYSATSRLAVFGRLTATSTCQPAAA